MKQGDKEIVIDRETIEAINRLSEVLRLGIEQMSEAIVEMVSLIVREIVAPAFEEICEAIGNATKDRMAQRDGWRPWAKRRISMRLINARKVFAERCSNRLHTPLQKTEFEPRPHTRVGSGQKRDFSRACARSG